MKNIVAIATKELKTYFSSPMAYIVAVVFLVITGYFFGTSLSGPFPEASLRGFLLQGSFILVVIAPLLTMRLLAEEAKLGTLELLLTNPVRDLEVVIGKYISSVVVFAVMLALTLYYPLVLRWFGDPDFGPILTGYLGFLLLGSSCLAVGLLASSFTSNQIVSAVVAFGILLIFWLIQQASSLVSGSIGDLIQYLSLPFHFSDFVFGVLDTLHVVYYASIIFICVFVTIRSVEARRWN